MQISVLTENHAGAFTLAEHGLSYLIEFDGKRILFDTGQSDMFLKNAGIMNVSMENIDMIVLSHGHFDHGDGLDLLSAGSLVCHPGCFIKRYRKSDNSYIGLKNSKKELTEKFNLITSSKPYKLSDKIFFLGEIPRLTEFESKNTTFIFEDGTPDLVIDDSALVLIMPEGSFVVTGCGHAGIVNTLEHAKKTTGIKKIYGVMGGFHLKEIDIQTKETIMYIKENKVKHVLPSHCTELPALAAFYDSFGIRQIKTGDTLKF
ncbi:MAG: MBL fold metallo-hydrolase [Bacteroidales bacterium]|jgi:7,8-dihydropterin-6-yl-methyl-4-(beta-D-ribofuranosyl)aminobenzene 5'-phosphate synthase|nr:MBL fold metallo-hydrolase [Bacteroidales bacterium]